MSQNMFTGEDRVKIIEYYLDEIKSYKNYKHQNYSLRNKIKVKAKVRVKIRDGTETYTEIETQTETQTCSNTSFSKFFCILELFTQSLNTIQEQFTTFFYLSYNS